MGGPSIEWVYGVSVGPSGNPFIAGAFNGSVDFDPGPGQEMRTSNGGYDCFLLGLNSTGDMSWVRTWEALMLTTHMMSASTRLGSNCTGIFHVNVDFDPSTEEDIHSSAGSSDAFLVKYLPDGSW